MLYLGADHRGFGLKEELKQYLTDQGIAFVDLGATSLATDDDFVDYAASVARAVAVQPNEHLGIVACGTGVGVDMVANKVKSVYSGLVFTPEQAVHARRADHINVIALSSDYINKETAIEIVKQWLATSPGTEERYQRRLNKIKELEEKSFR